MKKRMWVFLALGLLIVALVIPRKAEWNDATGRAIILPGAPKIKIGRWTSPYKNGAPKAEWRFSFGLPVQLRTYFPDGTLEPDGNFSGGHPVGEWVSYYSNRRIHTINVFDRDFSHPLVQKIFSESGEMVFHWDRGHVILDVMPQTKKEPNHQSQLGARADSVYIDATIERRGWAASLLALGVLSACKQTAYIEWGALNRKRSSAPRSSSPTVRSGPPSGLHDWLTAVPRVADNGGSPALPCDRRAPRAQRDSVRARSRRRQSLRSRSSSGSCRCAVRPNPPPPAWQNRCPAGTARGRSHRPPAPNPRSP